jgi:hypothetical protein
MCLLIGLNSKECFARIGEAQYLNSVQERSIFISFWAQDPNCEDIVESIKCSEIEACGQWCRSEGFKMFILDER